LEDFDDKEGVNALEEEGPMTPAAPLYDRESPRILVADVASGTLRPAVHPDWLVLASDHAPWRDNLLVEQHRRPPFEGPEHALYAHVICIRVGPPSLLEWRIAGERPRRQLVTPGDVHLTSAGVPTWNRSQEPFEILVLALAPSFMQHAAHEFTGAAALGLRNQRAIRDAQLLHLGLALQAELEAGCPSGRLYGEALATALAVHLLQHYAVCPPQLRSYHCGLPQARLRRVLEHMHAHLDQELSLTALAAEAQMSPYYFSRLFKQSTGLSPHQYLLHQRVERAKHLLADPRRKIAEVSDALGFPHQSHFTATFHTVVGMTPGAYRRQRGGEIKK
jgi:AraC family transcriptional regulator